MDAFVDAEKLTRVDLLKADVEGAELLILRGAANTLRRCRPLLVLECSVHSSGFGYKPVDLVRFAESLDYLVLLLDEAACSLPTANGRRKKTSTLPVFRWSVPATCCYGSVPRAARCKLPCPRGARSAAD